MKISRQRYLFDGPGTYTIDLAKSCSLQERKLHRQGQIFTVAGGLIKDSNNETTMRFNTAPDTWPMRTAWKRAKRMWDKHIKEGTEGMPGDIKPRYHDFKVYLNQFHGSSRVPVDAAGGDITPAGEWVYSQYHSEDIDWTNSNLTANPNREADSFTCMLVGPHHEQANPNGTGTLYTRVSAIQSWFDTRPLQDISGTPLLPAAIAADPLLNLFDEADTVDEIVTSLNNDNDQPPYDEDMAFGNGNSYAGHANLQRVAMAATQSGAGAIASVSGFKAMCGLVQVHITQEAGSGQVELLIDVVTKGEKI